MKVYNKQLLNEHHQSLTYDDISLIPTEISRVKTRKEVDTSSNFLGLELSIPIISSPMESVTGIEMAIELHSLGCLGIVNRFNSSMNDILNNRNYSRKISAISIALNTPLDTIKKFSEGRKIICIDTANANNREVLKKTELLKKNIKAKVIVGNIAHGASLKQLVDSGADGVRVGIGNGSVCSTSIQTGIGIGQVSSILDVFFARKESKLKIAIIADGGIKGAGDVAKAISLGADAVMLGRLLAGTRETPGEVIRYNDQLWKKYRGSASFGVKMKNEFIEGEETMISYKGAVSNVVNAVSDGLRSSMSYMNCRNIEELRNIESFAVLSHHSYLERLPKP
ncbi:MAG: guanosine monophosphate reductase [Ignavibacteriaceae bacterium]|nr:guanosine monophosphate reductase [Ignavibacteriaceae bacterium]MCU0364144.1 guanosine monophosphate reductase [Ignavibacteriaceae bacterium]